MIKGIFFDYGGVLSSASGLAVYEELIRMREINFSKDRFGELMMDERAMTGREGTFDAILKQDYLDIDVTAEELSITINKAGVLYEEVWDTARELKKQGKVVGIISDQLAESAKIVRTISDFNSLFDPILLSCEIGLCKNDERIFHKAIEMISNGNEIKPEELLMIDDNQNKLEQAKIAGWKTILYESPEQLKQELRSYGLLQNA